MVTSGVLVADEVQEFEQVKMLVGHMYHRTKRRFKVIDPYRNGPLAKETLELRDDRGNVLGEMPCQRIPNGHVIVIPTIFSKNDEYYTLKEITTLLRDDQKATIAKYELAKVTESLDKTTLTTRFVTKAGQHFAGQLNRRSLGRRLSTGMQKRVVPGVVQAFQKNPTM